MRDRCNNPNNRAFKNYGARGIKVCPRWNDYRNFIRDMGPKPSPKHTIERKDVNGDYTPENCVWATHAEQNRNRRSTKFLTYKGETLTHTEWSKRVGLSKNTIGRRRAAGWSVDDILSLPPNPQNRRAPSPTTTH